MSEEINLIPVGVWSSLALFQFGAAAIDLWKSWQKNRRVLTGYEKVQKGESVNGWRIAISVTSLCKKHVLCWYDLVGAPWPIEGIDSDASTNFDPFSLLLYFKHEMPDGRRLFFLSRFSLITDLSSDVFQVNYDEKKWYYEFSQYVTDRIVAVVFRQVNSGRFRLVFVDVIKKSHRYVTIESPFEWNDYTGISAVARGDAKKNRINLIFYKGFPQNNGDDAPPPWRIEIYDAAYEIPMWNENTETPIRPSAWQSISMPLGSHTSMVDWSKSLHTPMFILFDPGNTENVDDPRLVTFDRNQGWRTQSLGNWATSMRNTKLMNAAESFGLLNPPNDWNWNPLPPLRNLTFANVGHPAGAALFSTTYSGGVLQRSMRPPTLKLVAAERFCRSNPKTQFAELKKSIGFDIFDGILDDDDQSLPVVKF